MLKVKILIGRFQPLHDGHTELIRQAKIGCDHLIILLGSSNRPRSLKNPWTFKERADAILGFMYSQYPPEQNFNFSVLPINDYKYSDNHWRSSVVSTVEQHLGTLQEEIESITLVGHQKKGNGYLGYFRQWKYQEITTGININATQIREAMFATNDPRVPASVMLDYAYFQNEKKKFANYPHPETLNFVCSDAIIECLGHILLIKRKNSPGANTWALPGGFKNNDENRFECAVREAYEETNLRVPEKVFRRALVASKLFDEIDRGCGLPRETMAFHFVIEPDPDGSFPRANGLDDALEARWVPISDIMTHYSLFDDHQDIIQVMTGASATLAINNPRINY